jgi:hypothetical protein
MRLAQCFFKSYNERHGSEHTPLQVTEGDIADRMREFKETFIWQHIVEQVLPHASCLMPHASCLMLHASCLMPHASYLASAAFPARCLQVRSAKPFEHWIATELLGYECRFKPYVPRPEKEDAKRRRKEQGIANYVAKRTRYAPEE